MSGLVYNHYQILGVSEYASAEDIRAAYKSLAKKYHPDKHGGQTFYEEHFKKINEAYQTLSDPQKRARYDLQRQYRYTAPASRPEHGRQHAPRRRPAQAQYRRATPSEPQGFTISQLRTAAYVIGSMVAFGFLIIQFYGWMNRLTASDYISKGIALEKEGLKSAAYESYATALEFDAKSSEAWFHKGVLAREYLKNNTAALLAFSFAIDYSDEPDWKMYYYMGICNLDERFSESAIQSFSKALKLPGCPDSLYSNLGDAYFLLYDLDKALECYTSYLSKHPLDVETLIKRGLCHHRLNHYTLSMSDYQRAIELDPDNAAAYFYRAQVRFATGDHDGGVNDLDTSASYRDRRAMRMKLEMENDKRLDNILKGIEDSISRSRKDPHSNIEVLKKHSSKVQPQD